jgi:hypothetical protein
LTPNETNPSNIKESKDGITILLCANFRLPLPFIHKYKTPHCLRNLNKENLPVDYYVQASAWMDTEIFVKWFKDTFVPLVKEYLKSKNLEEKAALILDNAPCHPINLQSIDGLITCLFLPPNTTSLIQPMDQCVISAYISKIGSVCFAVHFNFLS